MSWYPAPESDDEREERLRPEPTPPTQAPAATEAPTRHVRAIEYSNDFAGVKLLRYPTEPAPAGEWVKTELSSMPTPVPAVGASDWWRKRADEIEVQVARSGSTDAMRCFTDMRTLLQSATAAAPASVQPVPASLSDEQIRAIYVRYWGLDDNEFCVPFARAIIDAALASSTPTTKGDA